MVNKNWKDYWKLRAKSKSITSTDMVQYCLLKALTAKGQNKKAIAQGLLRAAFTPVQNKNKLGNGRLPYDALGPWTPAAGGFVTPTTIFGFSVTHFMDEAGIEAYGELADETFGFRALGLSEPDYMFLFVRQDISKEQQAVQAAHAAFKAGATIGSRIINGDNGSTIADKTNFVLIGVQNEYRLKEVTNHLDSSKHVEYVVFNEPDLDNAMTAVATKPMKAHKKRFLRKYKKLVFDNVD